MTSRPSALARPLPALLLIALLIALDQAVKLWVEAELPLREPVHVMPMLALYRTYNEGIAFSFLSGASGWLLVLFTSAVVAFVLYLWKGTERERRLAHLGYALIIGGALGNLIDRIAYGHVVDYVLVYTQTWSFAVFNLADAFITIGAGAIILDEVIAIRARRAAPKGGPD